MKFFGRNFQKGYVFVLVACMIPFFIMLSSLVIDLGRGYVYKSRLQNIADAAALAGAMQMEHSGVVHLVSARPEDAVAETPTNEMISATNSSMESNNLSITDNVKFDRDLFEKDSKYYYCVAIRDYIPLLLAQKFLPDSFLPNGLPVTAYAWAALDEGENETDLFTQIYHIGETQTPKEFQDVNKILSNRAEKDIEDVKNMQGTPSDVGIKYNYSKDSNGNITVSRTETVTIRNFDDNTYYDGIKGNKYGNIDAWGWKYIYIEFQPDISISQNYAQIVDDKKYFPIMDWDVGDEFASGQSNIFRYDSVNINGTRKRHQSFNNIVNLLRDTYGLSKEEATEAVRLLLTSRIENIVPFNDVYKVRGKTKAELEYWEKKLSSSYTRTKEQQIADYNNNPYLAQLVARNIHDEICESDPLLVRIEGEDMDKELFGNNNIFYASSSRKFTFQINANNMSSDYRPLVIFYYGTQDADKKVSSEGGIRESQPVTLELNEDFKGILFAPNSPVIIKSNGHKLKGFVIGKSFMKDGQTVNPNSSWLYRQMGFSDNQIEFDDFNLLDIPDGVKKNKNSLMTFEQAKRILS